MKVSHIIGSVLDTVFKIALLVLIVSYTYKYALEAYDFGYRVFADEPMSVSGGRTITVGIAEDASLKEIANMLEEKGLIEDANLFIVQELLSAYHGKILPGIYDLSTDMKAEQMLEILSTSTEEEGEEEKE